MFRLKSDRKGGEIVVFSAAIEKKDKQFVVDYNAKNISSSKRSHRFDEDKMLSLLIEQLLRIWNCGKICSDVYVDLKTKSLDLNLLVQKQIELKKKMVSWSGQTEEIWQSQIKPCESRKSSPIESKTKQKFNSLTELILSTLSIKKTNAIFTQSISDLRMALTNSMYYLDDFLTAMVA